jgi:HSP20 family molecular chaperone IbpA
MHRIINLLRTASTSTAAAAKAAFVRPVFDRQEREREIELTVYLPGVSDADVEVAIEDRDLVVTARRAHPIRTNFSAAHLEKCLHDYRLRARLGAGIALDRLKAEFVDGMLRILLPTDQMARPWQVAVV